jgi:hypothetical protein
LIGAEEYMNKLEGKLALITGLAYLDMKSWGDKIADIINSATERPIGRIRLSTAGIGNEC